MQNPKNHKGTMLGIPIRDWLTYTNAAYLLSLLLTFALTATLWRVSVAAQNESEAALEKYKSDAGVLISKANAEADKAKEAAAKAILEAQKLRAVLAWRILTPQQADDLTRAFVASNVPIEVTYQDSNPESLLFSAYIFNSAKASGLLYNKQITPNPETLLFGMNISGPDNQGFIQVKSLLSAWGV